MVNMELETPRLLLRDLQAGDLPILACLWTNPDATRFMGGPRDYNELIGMLTEDLETQPSPEWNLWPLVEKATGNVIGHCGILDKEIDGVTEYEVNYILDPAAWGKGYATEIVVALKDYTLNQMGLDHVVALIDPENTASAKVARKAGLTHEKDTVRPDGKTKQVFTAVRTTP